MKRTLKDYQSTRPSDDDVGGSSSKVICVEDVEADRYDSDDHCDQNDDDEKDEDQNDEDNSNCLSSGSASGHKNSKITLF